MPGAKDVPPERAKDVLHARIEIAGTTLMASDVPPERFPAHAQRPISSLNVESSEEAERIYALLSDGGENPS